MTNWFNTRNKSERAYPQIHTELIFRSGLSNTGQIFHQLDSQLKLMTNMIYNIQTREELFVQLWNSISISGMHRMSVVQANGIFQEHIISVIYILFLTNSNPVYLFSNITLLLQVCNFRQSIWNVTGINKPLKTVDAHTYKSFVKSVSECSNIIYS